MSDDDGPLFFEWLDAQLASAERGTSARLAEAVGRAPSAISRWRSGADPGDDVAGLVADFFGVPADFVHRSIVEQRVGRSELRRDIEWKRYREDFDPEYEMLVAEEDRLRRLESASDDIEVAGLEGFDRLSPEDKETVRALVRRLLPNDDD